MPWPSKSEMMKTSDCTLPPPKPYPGHINHNNMGGTLLSKQDWVKFECKIWVDEMKQLETYDISYFSIKVTCLHNWLKKTFPKVSWKTLKEILYDLEKECDAEENHANSESEDNDRELDEDIMDADNDGGNESSDMFDSDSDKMEEDEPLTRNGKIKTIRWYVDKVDECQLNNQENVPEFVKNSNTYKAAKNEFIKRFIDHQFENSSSQEIAASHSQLPIWVQTHTYLKEKFKHRTKGELAKYRMIKNVNETCKELRNNPSKSAFHQRAMAIAAIICPRYGVPEGIEETRDVIEAAKLMKQNLFTGNHSILEPKPRKKKEVFPKPIFELADDFWLNKATMVEPDQHRRPDKVLNDGCETIPTRLQIMTDDEAYEQFKEDNEEKVKAVMKSYCDDKRLNYTNKKDSKYKARVLETLDRMQDRFPGKGWFLKTKPPQTKANNEHSTGNCKDCYSIELNYETLLKAARKNCKCRTDSCQGWQCTCELEEGETDEDCSCSKVCHCDVCDQCQVRNSMLVKIGPNL